MRKTVMDMFGNELTCGDMVCFVENLNTGWRQSPKLKRGQVKAIVSQKNGDFVICDSLDKDSPRISVSRIVKCY